jgi:mRNA export factor
VKGMGWIHENQMLVTGGYDCALKYWDLRSPTPALNINLPGKIHTLATGTPYVVVACGNNQLPDDFPIIVFNIQNPQQPMRVHSQKESLCKMACRSVAVSTDRTFFTSAGIEGRIAVQHFDPARDANNPKSSFTFRAHKDQTPQKTVNPIHDLAFHPKTNAFATMGADGTFAIWDKENKSRLKILEHPSLFMDGRPAPVVAGSFNASGSLFAFGLGYDWNLGAMKNNPQTQVNTVLIYATKKGDYFGKPQGQQQQQQQGR